MISLKNILLEGMSLNVANTIFAKYGVPNASTMDKDELRQRWLALVKKYHPDAGGTDDDMRHINAAYDVLKLGSPHASAGGGSDDFSDYDSSYNTYQRQSRQRRSSDRRDRPTGWAQAGWSGGAPNSDQIYNQNFHDLNYCKKTAWEISGKPPFDAAHVYTMWNWDGAYFRGVFSVYAVPEKLFEISKMMVIWDRWFKSEAVFFTKKTDDAGQIYLVNLRGQEVSPPKLFEHESFNKNAGNDQSFVNFLRKNL